MANRTCLTEPLFQGDTCGSAVVAHSTSPESFRHSRHKVFEFSDILVIAGRPRLSLIRAACQEKQVTREEKTSHERTVDMHQLRITLPLAWSRATSMDSEHWRRENPAWGQCAVTALVVQDFLGGSLVRAKVRGCVHYWNVLHGGVELDLTREQFRDSFRLDSAPEGRSREYTLSFPDTRRRYMRLRRNLARLLGLASPAPEVTARPGIHYHRGQSFVS